MKKYILFILLILAIAGTADSVYLTFVHYGSIIPPCPAHGIFIDCGKVLGSKYSVVLGIPLALFGVIHYSILASVILSAIITKKKLWRLLTVIQTSIGVLVSIYLMYLQLVVIGSICLYCTLSAMISLTLFILAQWHFPEERKYIAAIKSALFYQILVKPVLFLIDPETVHELMVSFGELLGKISLIKKISRFFFKYESPALFQTIAGINFKNPVGLAAGFDYDAKLTQILPSLNFGFETIGTVTNMPYGGNPPPRLGRLPKSKSLMVNKGFKSLGAEKIIEKLGGYKFEFPLGISIGRTNSVKLKSAKESIADIVGAFKLFEKSGINHSYYELNISCPNLFGYISFYPPNNLEQLLTALDRVRITKPVFVKMPIEKSDKEVTAMLEVINKFSFVKGVIFGNLQKNRKDKALNQNEVRKFPVGNFSGKPTEQRSNELINLAYKKFGKRFIIIGCGGIFSAEDAYKKIKLGASLVQLITGMIYQGPQLISQINLGLIYLINRDGYKHISEAIGKD